MIDDNGIDLHKREHEAARAQTDHARELINRFTQFLNERCDLHVANMVRPFLEQEK